MRTEGQSIESEIKPELETKIVLHFFRHGAKDTDPSKKNEEQLLTEVGRSQADEKGREIKPDPKTTLTYASPRPRTQETALRALLAESGETTVNDDLTKLEELAHSDLAKAKIPNAKKLVIDERLNFTEKGGPASNNLMTAFKEKRLLRWTVESSDQEMLETGDKITSSYSRVAGNVAELVKHYTDIGNTFYQSKIRKQENDKLSKEELISFERLFGTHQLIPESFICKVLEKTQGHEAVEKFLASIKDFAFAELQGFDLEVTNSAQGQEIKMTFPMGQENQTIIFKAELLDEIIGEKEALEKMISN